jgi:hypothetical protein
MRSRLQQMTGFVVIVGASMLLGCASVQTTEQFAASHGFQRTEAKGREYFCHQLEALGTPPSDTFCLTRTQLLYGMYWNGFPGSFDSPPTAPSASGMPFYNGGRY